jgi:CRP-like cAMP-binding protein
MGQPSHPASRNGLLAALSAEDNILIEPHFERTFLKKHSLLIEPNLPIRHVHFFQSAIASVVAISPEGHEAEAGMIGCDGMSAPPLVLDTDRTPNRVVIQVDGEAWRMPAETFRTLLAGSPTFASAMRRYAQAFQIQTAHTALSNATHGVEERLARWLLMCHDRSAGDEMALTHEFLSLMLAVRRPSVTTALHVLEGMRMIRARRGNIIMRDRAALEDYARDAYGVPEAEYARLIGPMPKAEALAAAARARAASQAQIDRMEQGRAAEPDA